MIQFNEKGHLFPDKNIPCSVGEFKHHFVDSIPSETRLDNFNKYIQYSNELKNIIGIERLMQWVNGSFVTQVRNPRDIDLVSFIPFNLRKQFEKELKAFEAKNANEYFGIDAYLLTVFPEGHESEFLYISDRIYWLNHFSKTRRDRHGNKGTKGFLEIIY